METWGEGAAGCAGDDRQRRKRKEASQGREHQPGCRGGKHPVTLNEEDGVARAFGMGKTQSEISVGNPESCQPAEAGRGEPGNRNSTYTGGSGERAPLRELS